MRSYVLTIVLLAFFPMTAAGQTSELPTFETSDFPRYVVDSASGTRCVLFTLSQAQKLDNDEELLRLYQLLHTSADSLIKALVFKIKVSDTEVAFLKLKITELEKVNASQNALITNLKEQIADYKQNVALANQQLGLKDEQLKNLKKEVRRQKGLKWVGYGVGLAGMIGALLLIAL